MMAVETRPETEILADAERAGTFERIPLALLKVDHVYQRELSADLVEKIARAWDVAVSGPIVVSRRPNGDLYIVDGQHRAAGATKAGETDILARVIDGLTAPTEAAMRLRGNVRRSDKSHERFRAQLAAGNPESLHIQEICSMFDTQINPWPDSRHGINSVSSVEEIYRRDQGKTLQQVFEFIRDTWNDVGGRNASHAALKGIAFLLERHPDIALIGSPRQAMMERLSLAGVEEVDRHARTFKATLGRALWVNYYRAFIHIYNERRSEANKLDFRLGKAGVFGREAEAHERGVHD
jgi:ParB-like nuclease domain